MNMTKKDKAFILLILSSIIVVWFSFSVISSLISKASFKSPDSYKLIAGNHQSEDWINLSRNLKPKDLNNRIILLDFWTYACVNCLHMVPEIKKLEEEFREELTVIGVHSGKFNNEKLLQSIKDAVIKYDIEHPVVNDEDLEIWEGFEVSAWPTLVLLNPNGDIDKVYRGEGNIDSIRKDIERLSKKFKYSLNTTPLPISLEKHKISGHILRFPSKLEYGRNFEYKTILKRPVLFISNSGKNNIIISSLSGEILLTIGSGERGFEDGDFDNATFNFPQGLLYKDGVLYVADTGNHALRKVNFKTGVVTTIAGSGARGFIISQSNDAKDVDLASPWDLEFFPDKSTIVIANAGTHQILKYDIKKNIISPFVGNGVENLIDGKLPDNALAQTSGLSTFSDKLYFVDSETSSLRVVDKKGEVKTLIGQGLFEFGYKNGSNKEALMQHPIGVFVDDTGAYIADTYNHVIRKYDLGNNELSDYSGSGEKGDDLVISKDKTSYNEPEDVISILTKFYIADTNNDRIVVIDRNSGKVSLLNVMPPLKLPKEGLLEYLPNLEKIPAQKVKGDEEISLILKLKKGWKINELGPSFFNLVEVKNGEEATLISHSDWKSIKSGMIKLPKLSVDNEYYLQGTVYYCEDKMGALCLVNSYEQKLLPKKGSGKGEIVINFIYDFKELPIKYPFFN